MGLRSPWAEGGAGLTARAVGTTAAGGQGQAVRRLTVGSWGPHRTLPRPLPANMGGQRELPETSPQMRP